MGLVALLAGCGQSYEEQNRTNRAERERLAREEAAALKVAVLPTIECMPVYLANHARWFDSTRVDLRVKVRNAQMDCDAGLKAGSLEVAMSDRKRMENMSKHGTPLLSMGPTEAQWQLLANRTARVKSMNQLGDKMVAMTRYSATDYLTEKALEGVKTSAPIFRIQINDVQVRLDMLLNNEMDAMWLPEPQATTARMFKHTVVKDSRKMGEKLGVVVVRAAIMKDARRREQLSAFVDGYNRACDSLNAFGVSHYAELVKAACHTDDKTVGRLPKFHFSHIALPK